jgi:(2Fe-2S) ferredoxin
MKYKKHVFICTNTKEAGKKCCGEEKGMALVQAFKDEIRNRGLQMDACNFGPSLVVYPEGTYYGHVQLTDVTEIVVKHLLGDQPVERLVLPY